MQFSKATNFSSYLPIGKLNRRYFFNCEAGQQHFYTGNNCYHYNDSRKRVKRKSLQQKIPKHQKCLNMKRIVFTKLDVLPNEVVEALIDDLSIHLYRKDDFFSEIELVDVNDLDGILSVKLNHPLNYSNFPKLNNNREVELISGGVSAFHPCSMCFQFLDSPIEFNQHMHGFHFNHSLSVRNHFGLY